jgi:hypothetical protein
MRNHLHEPPADGIMQDEDVNFCSMCMLVIHFVMQFESNGLSIFDSVFLDTTHFVPSNDLTSSHFVPVDTVHARVRRREVACVVQVQSSFFLVEFGDEPGPGWLRPGDRVTRCLDIVDAFAAWLYSVCQNPRVRGNVGALDQPRDVRSLYRRVWGRDAPHMWNVEQTRTEKKQDRERRARRTVPNGIML